VLRGRDISRGSLPALGGHHHDLMLSVLVIYGNIHCLVEFPSHVIHPVGVRHAIIHLLEQLRGDPRSFGGQKLQLMVPSDRLDYGGYSSTLHCLEIQHSCLIQVVELGVVPVGLRVAEVLTLIASSLFVLINNCRTSRDVILNVFERQVQLQIILLRRLLGSCICRR
jgi:hypothetical protein